ncbi:MAG: creatininase family protein [Candidatus Heimdallarchaeota archaeon]|nr:creatininase family protein [Candidatus Heimdallarchaeota archaeon]
MNFPKDINKAHLLLVLMTIMMSHLATGQIYNLVELTTTQFDELDRETTVIIIPTGVLEEHGPHLPLFTDGYQGEWLTRQLAEEIVAQRGRQVVIFPTFPIGVGEPEEFAPRKRFPGSYAVRPSTQRAVFMDIATGLGEDGFKWVFVMAFHGPLLQSSSIEQVCEYFSDEYGGTMVNFRSAIHPDPPAKMNPLSEEEIAAAGLEVHAGLKETSVMLFVRPDLVSPDYKNLETLTPNKWEELHTIAQESDWPGYFGAPNRARPDIGANLMEAQAENINDFAIKILDGLDPSSLSSYTNSQNPALLKLDEEILKLERSYTEKQDRWLESKGYK